MTGAINWTPKLRGNVFCSSACGSGCTLAQYHKAKEWAEWLALKCGPGWKPVVTENMGWFAKATKGKATVYKDGARLYSCFFSVNHQFIGTGSSPKYAIRDALNRALEHTESIAVAIEVIQS